MFYDAYYDMWFDDPNENGNLISGSYDFFKQQYHTGTMPLPVQQLRSEFIQMRCEWCGSKVTQEMIKCNGCGHPL